MSHDPSDIQQQCAALIGAYERGFFGVPEIPEDIAPRFSSAEFEMMLCYFTLPMSLNYRRSSTQLWKAALSTFNDIETRPIFSAVNCADLDEHSIGLALMRYKLAMQPTRHTRNWAVISRVVAERWGGFAGLLQAANYDYLQLQNIVQQECKRGFPYLSGPKLFNYWCFILNRRCDIHLTNSQYIDIAVDSHVRRASARIGVISQQESLDLPSEVVAERWRFVLAGSPLAPVQLNVPLWMWSRSGFVDYSLARQQK